MAVRTGLRIVISSVAAWAKRTLTSVEAGDFQAGRIIIIAMTVLLGFWLLKTMLPALMGFFHHIAKCINGC